MADYFTVELEREPIELDGDEWPFIASGEWRPTDDQEDGAEDVTWYLNVRRHADGRTIVYTFKYRLDDEPTSYGTLLPAPASDDLIIGAADLLAKNWSIDDSAVEAVKTSLAAYHAGQR